MVGEGLLRPDSGVEIKVTGSTGTVGAELATPLAVILTELIQNAIEHAFPEGRGGTIAVELTHDDHDITVTVWDDGTGIQDEALSGSRLGLQIVHSLIQELGGTASITSDAGTRVELRVPRKRGFI
jgi:two-component sensor histidine kinase